MKNVSFKLYSFAAPVLLLPFMGFGFDQIVPYVKGTEFRSLFAELLAQVFSGIANALINASAALFFGG